MESPKGFRLIPYIDYGLSCLILDSWQAHGLITNVMANLKCRMHHPCASFALGWDSSIVSRFGLSFNVLRSRLTGA